MSEHNVARRIEEAIGALGERYDREKIIGYLEQFLAEGSGRPPMSFIPEIEACAAAFVIMEDVARQRPKLVGSICVGDVGVDPKVAEIFTWGLAMGIYLASKGAVTWPTTKNLNS